ncbi:hypothetical protein C8R44DRAFT_734089 [Mycena epipterygia]|nr:hypothetical protein C8R44DRAFT_734089 [Mycena epipterygia]
MTCRGKIGDLKLLPLLQACNEDNVINGQCLPVVIKSFMLLPDGSPKLTDMLQISNYLWKHHIAHCKLWLNNLLLNTNFSNVILMMPKMLLSTDPTGIVYWQMLEVHFGTYDQLKINMWELAEAVLPSSPKVGTYYIGIHTFTDAAIHTIH